MTVKYNGHFRISLIVGQILFPLPWMNNRAESTVLDFFNPVFKGGAVHLSYQSRTFDSENFEA